MNWENLEIEYTPLPPLYSNVIVVADLTGMPGYCHVENEARTFGMRFRYIAENVIVPHRGNRVNLWGTTERPVPDKMYRATTVKILSSGNAIPKPLAMSMKSAGGRPEVTASQGPMNLWLLVKVSGKITCVGSGYVYISDGSNVPYGDSAGAKGVRAFTGRADLILNQFITATGIIELVYYPGGKMPVVRARNADDITIFQ